MNAEHASFLDRYYGATHRIYDATRKYYLFGRDSALDQLVGGSWSSLVEIGSGTGRNLAILRQRRPDVALGGLDASQVMLDHARARLPGVPLTFGFAEDADLTAVLGAPPDRILFSYCLSMVGDPDRALQNAVSHLAPGGEVWVVDFADLRGVPLAGGLRRWLRQFHVRPLPEGLLDRHGAHVRYGPGRYYLVARLGAPSPRG